MSHSYRRVIAVAALALVLAGQAAAHSTLKSTVPPDGAILPASPPAIELNFNAPARLTSVVVMAADERGRTLEFTPSGSATTFRLKAPELANGRNEIRWKALSKDGHPIEGTVVLVINPDSEPPQTSSNPTDR